MNHILISLIAFTLTLAQKLPFNVVSEYAAASYCSSIYESNEYKCDAYCNSDVTLIKAYGQDRIDSSNKRYTPRAVISRNDKLQTIFVSFIGSNSTLDWTNDAKFALKDVYWNRIPFDFIDNPKNIEYPGMQIHDGFQSTYVGSRNVVMGSLYTALQLPELARYDIIFTGHSMGGSVAVMAAIDFTDSFGDVFGNRVSVYTYGQPRTGNKKFALYVSRSVFGSRVYRVTRRGDPVVHIPTPPGYVYILQQLQLMDDGSVVLCENKNTDGTGETTKCQSDFPFGLNPKKHVDYWGLRRACP